MLLEADSSVELKYEQPDFFQGLLKNKEKKAWEKLKETLQIHVSLIKINRTCSVIFYRCVFASIYICLQSSCSVFFGNICLMVGTAGTGKSLGQVRITTKSFKKIRT